MPKIEGSHAIVWHTVVKSLQRNTELTLFFELKWLIPFSLSVLCASDNLDYILLQLTLYIKPQELRRLFVDPVSLQATVLNIVAHHTGH